MPFKFDPYQIAMFLRQIVGRCLMVCLFFEFFFGALALVICVDTDKFYFSKILSFIIPLLFPCLRFIITMLIVGYGYFNHKLNKKYKKSVFSGTLNEYFEKKQRPLHLSAYINHLSGKVAQQTIIALIITFLLSLFIALFPASLNYLNQAPPKSIKDFLDDFLSYFIFTSSISLSSIIYSLQFFWRNTALTWVINILLLIFPIAPVLFFICAFIFGI